MSESVRVIELLALEKGVHLTRMLSSKLYALLTDKDYNRSKVIDFAFTGQISPNFFVDFFIEKTDLVQRGFSFIDSNDPIRDSILKENIKQVRIKGSVLNTDYNITMEELYALRDRIREDKVSDEELVFFLSSNDVKEFKEFLLITALFYIPHRTIEVSAIFYKTLQNIFKLGTKYISPSGVYFVYKQGCQPVKVKQTPKGWLMIDPIDSTGKEYYVPKEFTIAPYEILGDWRNNKEFMELNPGFIKDFQKLGIKKGEEVKKIFAKNKAVKKSVTDFVKGGENK